MKNPHVLTIELSPEGHAALLLLAKYEGHDTLEQALLSSAAANMKSLFGQVLSRDKDTNVEEWLGLPTPEES